MEIYILDSQDRRTEVIDQFESMIWTERWQDIGDFELNLESTRQSRNQFTPGTKIRINSSVRFGVVDTVEDKNDDDGQTILNVKGHHIENILKDRYIISDTVIGLEASPPPFFRQDTPGNIMRYVIVQVFANGAQGLDQDGNGVYDGGGIPTADSGGFFPTDTIPEYSDIINYYLEQPEALYDAFTALCKTYDLGFRIYFADLGGGLAASGFGIYSGNDRTTRQSLLPPVVFATNLDSLQNTTNFKSIDQSKNVAYVFSDYGYRVIYAPGFDHTVQGIDRRVVVVTGVSIDDPTHANDQMDQAGRDALAQAKPSSMFDGEINQNGSYIYYRDYNLGDLVELRGNDGLVEYKRVSEQILVQDENGERGYPTLSEQAYVNLTTWFSETTDTWDDLTTEHWDDISTGSDDE